MKSKVEAFLIILIILFFLPMAAAGQDSNGTNVGTSVIARLDAKVSDFILNEESIFVGVQMLNRQNLQLGFGFEGVLAEKFSDPPVPYPKISVELKNPSTREALDAICAADPRYTWSLDGAMVNVYPLATMKDSTYFLNRKLAQLKIQGITNIEQGLFAIPKQLQGPLEQIAHAQVGGDASYPVEPWSITFQDITVRQAINRLVEHMGSSSAWVFRGSREFRSFAFYRGGFHTPSSLLAPISSERLSTPVF